MTSSKDRPNLYCGYSIGYIGEGPGADWCALHRDYDGAPDANDDRLFYAPSKAAVMADVDDWWQEESDPVGELSGFELAVFDEAFGQEAAA